MCLVRLLLLTISLLACGDSWATDFTKHANCTVIYTFNEASGNIDDKCSGGTNDGTVTDATPTTFYEQSPPQNNLFKSVLFDGAVDLVTFSSSISLGTTWTIVFWIKDNGFTGDYGTVVSDDDSTSDKSIYYRGSGGVDAGELTAWDDSSDHDSVVTFDDGNWHFVMVVNTAGTLDFWDDCSNQNNNLSFSGSIAQLDRMGDDSFGSELDNVSIDDFAIFDGSAFGQSECDEIKAKGLKRRRIL